MIRLRRTSWLELSQAPSVATTRAVAFSTAAMFTAGGVMALVTTALPGGPDLGVGQVRALSVAALLVAGGLFWAGPRLPRWSFHLVLIVAWLMVTRGVLVSGGGLVSTGYSLLYLLVVINAFTACSWLAACGHLLLAVAGTACALSSLPGDRPAVTALVCGVLAAMCGFVGRLVRAAGSAEVDALTGLPNRRGLDRLLEQALVRARRLNASVDLAVIDLDHFKQVNDTRGHAAGDQLLRDAARAWRPLVPSNTVLARWGGDEFVLVLLGSTAWELCALVDELRASLPAGQTCSAGTATWQPDEVASGLISRADHALYQAKSSNRGGTCGAAA